LSGSEPESLVEEKEEPNAASAEKTNEEMDNESMQVQVREEPEPSDEPSTAKRRKPSTSSSITEETEPTEPSSTATTHPNAIPEEKCIKISEIEKNIEFFIITQVHWPNWEAQQYNLPKEVLNGMESFKMFYLDHHNGRKLDWMHGLGNVVLRMDLGVPVSGEGTIALKRSEYELTISVFQALVLLCFNENNTMTLSALQTKTNLEPKELKRAILSLALGKTKIILRHKNPKAKSGVPEILDDDTFTFNKNFQNENYKIKISQALGKDISGGEGEDGNDKDKLDESKQNMQHVIEAAIVRVMKENQKLSHNRLFLLVIESIKVVKVSVADVKKGVENMIDKDYIARWGDEEEEEGYNYLA